MKWGHASIYFSRAATWTRGERKAVSSHGAHRVSNSADRRVLLTVRFTGLDVREMSGKLELGRQIELIYEGR